MQGTQEIASPPIVHTRRADMRDAVVAELDGLGVPTAKIPKDESDCIELLFKNPDSVLVIDWELGSESVNRILGAIKGHFLVETRPIFLTLVEMVDTVIATAAEYGVLQVHAGPISRLSIKECLEAMFLDARSTAAVRQGLIQVADARGRKDWRLATGLLKQLKAQHPDHERVVLELAENHIVEGHWEAALAVLDPFVGEQSDDKPVNVRAMHLMGRCYLQMGKPTQAIDYLAQAKIINPHNVDRLVDLGNAFFNNNEIALAQENFEAAQALDGTRKDAIAGKSKCLLANGEVNEALKLLKGLSGPREMASIFNTAAVLSMRNGQFEKGMSLYRSALAAVGHETYVQARLHFNMGLGYRRWQKLDQALKSFTKAIELDPKFEKARRHKELAEQQGGATAKAGRAAPATTGDLAEHNEEAFGEESFAAFQRAKSDKLASLPDKIDDLGELAKIEDDGDPDRGE